MTKEFLSKKENARVPREYGMGGAQFKDNRFSNADTLQRETLEDEELMQGKFQSIQRVELEDEEPMQGKFDIVQKAELEDEELMQGKFGSNSSILQKQQNNAGLPDNLKSGIENLSGMTMDSVKVHQNSSKPAEVGAHAYTQGTDIHVAPGQMKHLPHEAWHVVQQAQGRVPVTTEVAGMPVNDNPALEAEADNMGEKALKEGK